MSESRRRWNKTVFVPEDISAVTRFDPAEEADPGEVGLTRTGVDVIWSGVTELYRTGIHPAISFCLRRHGKVVLKRSIGHVNGNGPDDCPSSRKTIATPATPFCMFSGSKAALAMLIHKLAERRQVRLNDPLCHYVPEFGSNGKDRITIHHALTHTAGIPAMPPAVDRDTLLDFDACVHLICALKPRCPPGTRVAYHTMTAGFVLAEIVRRVTGQDIRQFLRSTIQDPLGFRYFNYGAREEDVPEIAANYVTGLPIPRVISGLTRKMSVLPWKPYVELTNDARCMRSVIPTVNLIATADEACRFYQMLLNHGEFEGKRLFDRETVEQALRPASGTVFDGTLFTPMRYSEGFMLGNRRNSLFLPHCEEAFGHWGFASMVSWADPSRAITGAMLNTGKAFLGPYALPNFRLYALIRKHCPRVQ
jgi:CubicO group peptidase (beta-lactamase class C family)